MVLPGLTGWRGRARPALMFPDGVLMGKAANNIRQRFIACITPTVDALIPLLD